MNLMRTLLSLARRTTVSYVKASALGQMVTVMTGTMKIMSLSRILAHWAPAQSSLSTMGSSGLMSTLGMTMARTI